MPSTKLLVTGAVIAGVAAAAILVPSVASGIAPAPLVPASVVAPDDGPGNNGRGNAFGHDKDSPDFPGNKAGKGEKGGDGPKGGNGPNADKHADGPGEQRSRQRLRPRQGLARLPGQQRR
ncbi:MULTISPECIES: hypothetical protein [Microbacterium]|uniref:hypothetical protein n=1 Tax=Microbacterium TaxID=33882 RepID=UPI000D6552FF|nr:MULTISPECIES: hypothetical protein [Microbacterium]